MSIQSTTCRMVDIEFLGGPRDGEVLAGDVNSPDSLAYSASVIVALANDGRSHSLTS